MSDFDWCCQSPPPVLQVPACPRLPVLLDPEVSGSEPLPRVPADAAGRSEPLVVVRHPRIRSIGSYWHMGLSGSVGQLWLRRRAADRLVLAAESLRPDWGLAVFDGWRDPSLQQELYQLAYSRPGLPPGFVSRPSPDPATPTPHTTGGAVDLTLTWRNRPLAMGTGFDEFDVRAFASSLEAPDAASDPVASQARDLRRLLYATMSAAGFVVLAREWWHFEYGTRLWAGVGGRLPLYPAASRPSG
ncbi:MAG: zinc D-Ala-D-Ala dipeptidase [Actinomycetota bacterium]|nr:zinc D-Ala-D-Ala dipeptidase [Actinomycetota bacterium]